MKGKNKMITADELFEIGSPMIVGEKIFEGSGNTEKLFATFNILFSYPVFFPKDLNQLRITSQNAIHRHFISSKLN